MQAINARDRHSCADTRAAVGLWMVRKGKPYGAARLSLHFALFLLVAAGVIAAFYKLTLVHQGKLYATVALSVVAVTVLANLIVGLTMAFLKKVHPKLVRIHKISTIVTCVSLGASIVFLAIQTSRTGWWNSSR